MNIPYGTLSILTVLAKSSEVYDLVPYRTIYQRRIKPYQETSNNRVPSFRHTKLNQMTSACFSACSHFGHHQAAFEPLKIVCGIAGTHFLWYHSLHESHSAHQREGNFLSELSRGIPHSHITGTS